jgi:hypothetical protein
MEHLAVSRLPEDQTARAIVMLGIVFDDLAGLDRLYDLVSTQATLNTLPSTMHRVPILAIRDSLGDGGHLLV